MHRDLHNLNYFWDGDAMVTIFGWNMAVVYDPIAVIPIHHHNAPERLFPPEARTNTSAVHTSVYAYDVYTIGKLARGMIKSCCDWEQLERDATKVRNGSDIHLVLDRANKTATGFLEEAAAYDLVRYMMHPDPYQRPDTIAALQHPFFSVTNADDTNSEMIRSFRY
mmetsp:Transcript_9948/g.21359  ORF Transcript_9948/g.21359 Transcript_9948/m.21359 type:complete len:166 (-) Transcript_9948:19-516(-)